MEDRNKFTAGPWEAQMGEVYAVRDAEGGRVALMTHLKGPHGTGGRRHGNEVVANTMLISAAPDLLFALQALTGWMDLAEDLPPHQKAAYEVDLNKARAAISKALGA